MGILKSLLIPFQIWNDVALKIGRAVGIVAIGLMVLAILIQVFFRYVLNNALPWPDEAARFMMLWLTGLMAPTAYRRGGFVAIDMAVRARFLHASARFCRFSCLSWLAPFCLLLCQLVGMK